jgi:hypothetical protein
MTPRDNEAFYREVDEEVRRDQLVTWWKRYGKLAIGGVILVIAAIGAFFWWQARQEAKTGAQAAELSAAFEDIAARDKASAASRLNKLARSESSGYRASALLTEAGVAVENNDMKGAAALYRQVAGDKEIAQPWRDLATIRLTYLEYDSLPPQTVIDRLKPFAVAGNPWFGSAGEMSAMAFLKQNKAQEAARIFAALAKDQKVPESIRTRAAEMSGSLGAEAGPAPAATLEK